MNSSVVQDQINPALRIFGASSYLILNSISVFLNLSLLVVLVKGHKDYQRQAFYIIVWQLVICDLVDNLVQFIIVIPIMFAGFNMYGASTFFYTLTLLDAISYNGIVTFCFLMTVNRTMIFFFPRKNKIIFEPNALYGVVLFGWFISIGINVYRALIGIKKDFDDSGFYWFNKFDRSFNATETLIKTLQKQITQYLPVAMLAAYLCIYGYLKLMRSKNKTTNSKNNDFALILQSFLICGGLVVEMLGFSLIPYIPADGQWKYLLNFAQNWLTIFIYANNPMVIYIFNTEIRTKVKTLLGLKKKSNISSTPIVVAAVNCLNAAQNRRVTLSVISIR